MDGYFDIHCHILPEIDDGAQNVTETIQMLQEAYKDGIRNIIATPHYHPRRGHAPKEKVLERLEQVREIVKKQFPGMNLYQGQEIYWCHDALDKIKDKELLTLQNSQYLLVEFSVGTELRKIMDGLNNLLLQGYSPILAHVERYEALVQDMQAVEELTEAGVYLQVNGGSLMGQLGGSRKRFIKKLLKADLVSFIASDAHDSKKRKPQLSKCADYVTKKFGKEMTERIFYENPKKVIENKII